MRGMTRPEHPGVVRHRNNRQFEVLRQKQKARLVFLSCPRFHPVAFGKDDNRPVLFHPLFGRGQHVFHGSGAGRTVDGYQPVKPLSPAEKGNIGQLFFQNHHAAGYQSGHGVSFQRRFVLAGIERALLVEILAAAHLNAYTPQGFQAPQGDMQLKTVPIGNHPFLRHKPAENTGHDYPESNKEINPQRAEPRTYKKHVSPPLVCRFGF